MEKKKQASLYSGASPDQVASDLKPLVDFQDKGLALESLHKLIKDRLIPHLMKYDLPGIQSMYNVLPEAGAKLGGEVALEHNQGVTNWQYSPGGAMLEELCCQSLCRLFGFSHNSDATFMYCGTYANQQALYLALHRKAEKYGFDLTQKGIRGFKDQARLAVLCSSEAHFSLRHAVRLMGLGDKSILPLAVDKNRRIDVKRMKDSVKELQKTKDIFCLVSTAGTTSTGSVDPILPMKETSEKTGAWIHVDGAYGLIYSLIPEYKPLFTGFEHADSVSWDPHKQLGVPIPSSLLFVRRREDFHRVTIYSDYFNREEDTEPNPGIKSIPSTRPFIALPLVTTLRHQGIK